MASTYTPIATTTLGSAQASVTFSSISGSYTDLVIISSAFTANLDMVLQFNGDTGTNYSVTLLEGTGTAARSDRYTAQSFLQLDAYGYPQASNPNVGVYSINNYANTFTYKTLIGRSSNGSAGVDAVVGLWRNTAAINQIVFKTFTGGNINAGSTFTLYGIKAA